jgi:hypothetical protein
MATLFERLGQPTPTKQPYRDATPDEKLLDWVMNYWTEDTLTVRDICALGPNPTRDRKKAFDAAEALVKRGCLAPVKAHRRDSHEFKIVWKTSPPAAAATGK